MAEAHESASLLIPEMIRNQFQAGKKRDWFYLTEHQMRIVAALEIVVRNSRTQVVDMMIADVSCEPLQDLRQTIKRATLQRSSQKVPLFAPFPIGAVELMLDVKEPHPQPARNHGGEKLYDDVFLDAEGPAQ